MAGQRGKRTYWRERDARLVLGELRASGKPVSTFAREHGISVARLYRWRTRLESTPTLAEFLPMRLTAAPPEVADLELLIGDGIRVRVPRGFCTDTLGRLLAVLGGEASC